MTDVVVIGAGPAGMIAALCAAELGARVALVARTEFGGMATNELSSSRDPCSLLSVLSALGAGFPSRCRAQAS